MVGDPLHSVDSREMVVLTLGEDFAADSGVAPLWAGPEEALGEAAWASLASSSEVRPFSARGAGSRPFLMNLSAKEAKHFNAPSATAWSSYLHNKMCHLQDWVQRKIYIKLHQRKRSN